jgi:hypothetical protein
MCHIQISEDTYRLLPPELYGFRPSGGVEMKVRQGRASVEQAIIVSGVMIR